MPLSERFGDRRAEVRFEIIGDLWSTFVTTQSLPLLDLGPGGMLVECGDPLIVGSQHRVRLSLGDDAYDITASVKHVTPGRDHPARYVVGLAFVSVSPEMRERIAAFMGPGGAAGGRKEA